MKSLISFLVLLFTVSLTYGQTNPQWIRYQAISPDGSQIAFTYKGDLYAVSAQGGDAQQLTLHDAHDYMPVWSRDGQKIAFASKRYGNFDIYIMDLNSGDTKRLTYHSNDEAPYSFSPDGNYVLFGAVRQDKAEHRQYPTGYMPELYKVPVQGGRVDQVFTIPAEYVQISDDGSQMVYHDKKGGENEWRKHHTSSVTRDIWTYDREQDKHTMITSFKGEDRQPVYSDDNGSIYYLSEESGTFNVHKLSLATPSQNEQLTEFDTHPVRFLSYGNGTLAFGYDGELYTMREGGQPQKVAVNIRSHSKENSDKFITINGGVGEMAISPDGKEIAFTARGEVFLTNVDGSLTKRITNTPEQEQFVTFTHDGESVVYASERDGKWSIYQTSKVRDEEPFFYAATLLEEQPLVSTDVDNYLPRFSPDGKKLAYIADRRTLRVRDLESGDTNDLMTPEDLFHMRDGDKYFRWSPDSRWLLVDWNKYLANSEVLLLAADGSERINLTESGYSDGTPQWVNGGKQMIWFSDRHGLRDYAKSGSNQRDVYTMFFTEAAWDKYNMSEEDYKLMQAVEEASKKDMDKDEEKEEDSDEEAEDVELTFDWKGLKDRTDRLTIYSSFLSDAVLSKDGEKLYYLARFEQGYDLWETNIRTRETKELINLNTGFGNLMWDQDRENLYLLSRGSISKVDLSAGRTKNIRISGEMAYDAEKEREHLFEHIYNRTRDIFYEPTYHGTDLEMYYEEYQDYLPHIGNSFEFAEMVSELLGELNVSHAGARTFGTDIDNPDQTASLGIFMDYGHEGNGIRIKEVLDGGPLDKAKFDIEPGAVIEKIDGETITPDRDVASYLNRKSGDFVLLEIVGPGNKDRRQITVKPITLGAERRLLYDRFVKINEQEVIEKSDGKLGYVHIPGMSDGPYRDIYEDILGKFQESEAIVVDTRFNGGGDLVSDLAMFFTGQRFITFESMGKRVGWEPAWRWSKPTISLFNESMYSDGHCYASAYTQLNIGKTVGMPVPGTCSFAGWEGLPNNVFWGVIPVTGINMDGEYMENNQVAPDIRVKNMPGVISEGRDQQLERAIRELMKEVEN